MEQIEFKATLHKPIYQNEGFGVYAMNPTENTNTDELEFNRYGNISISGDLPELHKDVEYTITAEKTEGKYGPSYKVYNIEREIPVSTVDTKTFLQEILTERQAKNVLDAYPNILELVMDGKEEEIDPSRIHGVGDITLGRIIEKIIDNFKLSELIAKYSKYNISLTMLRRLYNKYGSVDTIESKLEHEPYVCLCRINGIGFKKADKMILNMKPELKDSKKRMVACIDYILTKNEQSGHIYMQLKDVYGKALELANASAKHFGDALKDTEHFLFLEETNTVCHRYAYKAEADIYDMIQRLMDYSTQLPIEYSKYNSVDGFPLTEEQMGTTENFCKYSLSLLEGWAGTGKSFSTSALINLLEDNNMSYILMAPTGKASKVMSEYTGKPAYTIHRALMYMPMEGFYYNENNVLDTDAVIVDEASMVDVALMRSLLMAIDPQRTRLVLIQDPSQIPSVGAGNVSHDLLTSNIIPKTTLTQVFRYKEGGLAKICTKVRNGEKYLTQDMNGITTFGEKKDYSFIKTEQEMAIPFIVKLYKGLLDKGADFDDVMVLSAYNKGNYGTTLINNAIQQAVNPESADKHEVSHYYNGEKIIFREGDKVMQVVNNYNLCTLENEKISVFNGNTGIVRMVNASQGVLHVEFDGKIIVYKRSNINQLVLGYAISIHKSQGSSANYVITLTPKSHKYFLNRNLLYVALTRAKEKVYHIATMDVVNSALRKSENLERRTYLGKFLKGKMNPHKPLEELRNRK